VTTSQGTVVDVTAHGATPDDDTDDQAAIEAAIDALEPGDTLLFPPGTYVYSDTVDVTPANILIQATGATLAFHTPANAPDDCPTPAGVYNDRCCGGSATEKGKYIPGQSLLLHDGAVLDGLKLTTDVPIRRGCTPQHHRVSVMGGANQRIVNVQIEGGSAAGMLLYGTTDYVVAGNSVIRTQADAIHNTGGSRNGRIFGNFVRENGDDMIAVVSYVSETNPDPDDVVKNILIQGNDVAGQYWGRGITVVGGEDVTIVDNKIAYTSVAAGIMLHRETSYKTWGVHNVLVTNNVVEHVQTDPAVYNPINATNKTGHAGIDLYGQGSQTWSWNEGLGYAVERVRVENNTIFDTAASGMRLQGRACDVAIRNNTLQQIGGGPINVSVVEPDMCPVLCESNTIDGGPLDPAGCSASSVLEATGSTLTCP
jgi:polygalacturonase